MRPLFGYPVRLVSMPVPKRIEFGRPMMTPFPMVPRVGHPIPEGQADRYVGRSCAHCAFWFRAWGDVIDRKPRFAGRAGIVCAGCWHDFIRGSIYRKHCGV
jgi:hypothetical protein